MKTKVITISKSESKQTTYQIEIQPFGSFKYCLQSGMVHLEMLSKSCAN